MSELGNVLSRHAHIFLFIAFLVILAVFACGEASAESTDGWGTPLVIGGSPENSFNPDLDVANSGMAASAWEEWPAQAYVSIYGPGSGWSE